MIGNSVSCPELQPDRFTELELQWIVDHASKPMVEFGFQLSEGLPAGVAGFAFHVDGGQAQTLEPAEGGFIQLRADGQHDQACAVGDGLGQDHARREFFDHDAFHASGLCGDDGVEALVR